MIKNRINRHSVMKTLLVQIECLVRNTGEKGMTTSMSD